MFLHVSMDEGSGQYISSVGFVEDVFLSVWRLWKFRCTRKLKKDKGRCMGFYEMGTTKIKWFKPIYFTVFGNVFRSFGKGRIRFAVYVARMSRGLMQSYLFEKSDGKRPLGRAWRRWRDSIYMHRKEILYEDVEWMYWLRMGYCGHSREHK